MYLTNSAARTHLHTGGMMCLTNSAARTHLHTSGMMCLTNSAARTSPHRWNDACASLTLLLAHLHTGGMMYLTNSADIAVGVLGHRLHLASVNNQYQAVGTKVVTHDLQTLASESVQYMVD